MGATAVSVTVTAVNPAGNGWLEAAPQGSFVQGAASVLNYQTGEAVANSAILKLPANGKIIIWTPNATDVSIDVNGYFSAPQATYTYTYDGDGLRRTKNWYGLAATYRYSLAESLPQPIAETFLGVATIYFIYGPNGLPVAQIGWDGTTVWFHHDQLGSTRLLTDHHGNWRTKYAYDPYGNPTATHTNPSYPTVGSNHRYTGQYTDNETGYQYLRARYYDPTTARFLTRDPLVSITREAYAYVGGSPLNAVDPSGLFSFGDVVRAVASPVVTAVGAAAQVVRQVDEDYGKRIDGAIQQIEFNVTGCLAIYCRSISYAYDRNTGQWGWGTPETGWGLALGGGLGVSYASSPSSGWAGSPVCAFGAPFGLGLQACTSGGEWSAGGSAGLGGGMCVFPR
jgi:RHS repeat-associated protein